MSDPQPPVIEPVPDDGVSAVTVGLVVWALATVLCLLMRGFLEEHGVSWWLWTCVIGVGIGLFMRTLFRERVRRAGRSSAGAGAPGPSATGTDVAATG